MQFNSIHLLSIWNIKCKSFWKESNALLSRGDGNDTKDSERNISFLKKKMVLLKYTMKNI